MNLSRPTLTLGLLGLALATPLLAQVDVSGLISVSASGTSLDGDRPAFQQRLRQSKAGFGGIEDFSLTRATDSDQFRFEARALPGDGDYHIFARWEKFAAFYLESDFRRFRIFYDGSGGRLLPRNLALSYFPEDLAIDRTFFHVEFGTLRRGLPQFTLRYDHNERDGTKNSLRWGDTNLGGPTYAPRALIPSYLEVNEARDIFTFTVMDRTESDSWKLSARHERTRTNNHHVARRRMGEPANRYVAMTDGNVTDLFTGYGQYERRVNDQLRISAGGLAATIDTNLTGSKIYGNTPDAPYVATAARQSGDVGYTGLLGETQLKQYVANAAAVYLPTPRWQITPAVKFEHVSVDGIESHTDTTLNGTTPVANPMSATTGRIWGEFTGDLEVRYLRWPNLGLAWRSIAQQGSGTMRENSILSATQATVIDHNTNQRRVGQRHTLDTTWYIRPGLTLGLQLNYRLKLADYRPTRDNTSNATTSGNRYPAYLIDQDVASADAILRLSWRPSPAVSLVTRYAMQHAVTTSTMAGLPAIDNGRLSRHSITQTAIWTVTSRLYLNAAVNLTYDQLVVPRNFFTMHGDNNYASASVGGGYALGKITDLFLDYQYLGTDNFTDNSLATLPLNADFRQHTAFLTWVRRQGPHLVYTLRYGFATNRDVTYGGQNDFTAHLLYGKVQYRF